MQGQTPSHDSSDISDRISRSLSYGSGSLSPSRHDNLQIEAAGSNVAWEAEYDTVQERLRRKWRYAPPKLTSKAEFGEAARKGLQYTLAMKGTAHTGLRTSTKWDNFTTLSTWGWQECCSRQYVDYGFSDEINSIVNHIRGTKWCWKHSQDHTGNMERKAGGQTKTVRYPPTDAEYHNTYWPSMGLIVTNRAYSPSFMVKQRITPQHEQGHGWDAETESLPDLRHWSDVTWLVWKQLVEEEGGRRDSLRYFIRRHVPEEDVSTVMRQVLGRHSTHKRETAPGWEDRIIITPDMYGFYALLATPELKDICYLLLQHQDKGLGKKKIANIIAWNENDQEGYSPSFLVEFWPVEPVPRRSDAQSR